MADLKKAAQQIAAKGRYGDTMLLHVNRDEVAGLASLLPSGQLPVNPATGLPEAFFFLPFLASLFGAAAPAAAAATAAAPVAAGAALGAGAATAAGTAAATAATPTLLGTIGSIGSGITHGIGSLFGAGTGAGTTAAGLGVDTMTTSAIGGGGGSAASLLPATAPIPSAAPAASLLPATAPVPTPAAIGMRGMGNAISDVAGQSFAQPAVTQGMAKVAAADPWTGLRTAAADPWAGARTATAAAPQANVAAKTGLGGLLNSKNLMYGLMGTQMLKGLMGSGGSSSGKSDKEKEEEGKKKIADLKYKGGDEAVFPDSSHRAGDSEWDYYPNRNNGGLIRGYANGGIVGLAEGGPVDPQMQMPQDQQFPMNGIGTLMSPEQIPQSEYPNAQIGTDPPPTSEALGDEEIQTSTPNDRELIAQTVEAIKGKLPQQTAQQVVVAFVNTFGNKAFQDLVDRVESIDTKKGRGDGMSDSIPARIDGQQEARLSEGEYVVPADAVSGLGNGSTDAGAAQLDELVGGVRQAKTGSARQPPPVQTLNGGGLVSLYGR